MNNDEELIIQEVYIKTTIKPFTVRSILETSTGFEPLRLNIAIEDLKLKNYLIENNYGIELSHEGKAFCQSRWA